MKKKGLALLLLWQSFTAFSQFSDNFSDGRFLSGADSDRVVDWIGDNAEFMVNESLQLQLYADGDYSPSQLKTRSSLVGNTSWEFYLKMDFVPTASNYAKIYIASNEEDLAGELDGLFIRVGYTDKNVCLVSSQKGKNNKTLIQGTKKRLDFSSVALRVKATLDNKGNFKLYSQLDGEDEFTLEGSCLLTNIPTTDWFGVVCIYSKTRSKLFYFDDFIVSKLSEEDPEEEPKEEPESEAAPNPGDIIINELLFNAFSGKNEYVELYNRSDKVIDLRYLSITSRKPSDGSFNKLYPLTTIPLFLYPQEYLVVTKSKEVICEDYNCQSETFWVEIPIMPSIANASGCVVVLNNQSNEIIDEFPYNEKMHSPGVKDKKGVALERINFEGLTNDADNWQSATAQSGHGTPGYANSQRISDESGIENEIHVEYPAIDINEYRIKYRLSKPGYQCKVYIYDSSGRKVDSLLNGELVGTEGEILWNGKGNRGQRLTAGIYIVYIELFDTSGDVQKMKLPVVLK